MGAWWRITKLEVGLILKDRQATVWSLIVPLAFTAFFGSLFHYGPPEGVKAAYHNGNNPPFLRTIFESFLTKEGIELAHDEKLPLVAPCDSLIAKLVSDREVEVKIKVEEESFSSRAVAVKVQQLLFTLAFAADESWLEVPPSDSIITATIRAPGQIRMNSNLLGRAPRRPGDYERTLPAILVMFTLFSMMTFFARLWVEDVATGKIRRMVLTPTPLKDLFLGQTATRFLYGSIQVAAVFLLGTLFFRIHWELPVVSLVILIIAYTAAVTSLGMLFATFFKNAEKANGLGVGISLVIAAVGGCWWPLEFVPDPMKVAALFTPTGLAMDAIGDFLANGRYSAFPFLNVTALLAMAVVAMPLAIKRIKKQVEW